MTKLIEKTVWIFLLFVVFDAPLRFFSVKMGVPFLIYFKDVLIIILLFKVSLNIAYTGRINKTLMVLFVLLAYGISIGLLNQLNLLQILFGTKITLPFLFGFIIVSNFGIRQSLFRQLFKVLVPIILLGLIFELFYDMPWKGMEYEAYGATIETSREWGTFGLPRLSGFGRISYETAALLYSIIAMYFGVQVYEGRRSRFRENIFEALLLVIALLGIVLTTSKSAILTSLVLTSIYLILLYYQYIAKWLKNILSCFLKSALYILFLYGIIPPIVAFISPLIITRHMASDNILFLAITSSFTERVEYMWPDAFNLFSYPYQYFTGKGIGAIGAAQKYFENNLYNAADNLYVYLFVDFGIVILALFLFALLYFIFISRLDYRRNVYLYFLCITLFGFGATLNLIESSSLAFTAGFFLAMWLERVKTDN